MLATGACLHAIEGAQGAVCVLLCAVCGVLRAVRTEEAESMWLLVASPCEGAR